MAATNSFNHPYGVPAAAAATAASTNTTIPPIEGSKQKGGASNIRRLDSAAPNKRNMPANQYNSQNQRQPQREENVSPKRSLQVAQRQQQQYSDAIQNEDNLEYFIKFPTPNYRSDAMDTGDSDFVFVYNDSNVPIVMLLGWAGCQDRYLMKYSKIYEDRG